MPHNPRLQNLFSAALFIILVYADQLSKYLICQTGGFYICNKGIAFGLAASSYLFFLFWSLSIFALVFLLILKFKAPISNQIQNIKIKKVNIRISRASFLPLILISSGALSNIIDRLRHGCVIDFIDLKFWPVFNLADSFIVIGAIILIAKNINSKN